MNTKLFLISTVIFLILDLVWLGILAKDLYIHYLGDFLRLSNGKIQTIIPGAIVVYLALIAGICLFVYPLAGPSIKASFIYGALFGAISYAIYDFTNYALIDGWPLTICIIDTCWGAILCGITAGVTRWIV